MIYYQYQYVKGPYRLYSILHWSHWKCSELQLWTTAEWSILHQLHQDRKGLLCNSVENILHHLA